MRPSLQTCTGQALVEFLLVLPLLVFTVLGTFWILNSAVRRTECSRTVFEAVHSAREGNAVPHLISRVWIRKNPEGIEGRLKCGAHTETLFLPHFGKRKVGA